MRAGSPCGRRIPGRRSCRRAGEPRAPSRALPARAGSRPQRSPPPRTTVPPRGAVIEHDRRLGSPQLELKQVREEVVVAKPRARVDRRDERVGVLEGQQDRLRPRIAGQSVGERAHHPLQHGCAQEQVAHLGRLALQHLRQQIAHHRALAGELGYEALGVGCSASEIAASRRPAPLGPLAERREPCPTA